ncbi:MAG: peptidylprolyl isomerase [Thermodesulfobacteriota bacterium]
MIHISPPDTTSSPGSATGWRNHGLLTVPLLLLITLLGSSPCSAEIVDRVMAVVNNEVITMSEVNETGEAMFRKLTREVPANQLADALSKAREATLTNLIESKLILQEAEKHNISVSENEIEGAARDYMTKSGMTSEEFSNHLKSMGMNEADFRKSLKNRILQSKLTRYEVHSKIVVTDDEILDYYDTHYTKHLDEGGYYLLQMGFSLDKKGEAIPASSDSAKEDARKRAERVRALALGGQDFKELARKFSDLPSAVDGGDIGSLLEDDMADNMKKVILPLKAGEISQIVETPAGYQFYKLLSSREGQIVFQEPYETVEKKIRKIIYDKKAKEDFEAWVTRVKESAYIKRM